MFDRKNSLAKSNVWLGKLPVIDLVAKKSFKEIVSPFEFNKTKIKLRWNNPIPAPITKGDKVGEIFIEIPGRKTIVEDLVSLVSVEKLSPFLRAKPILKFLLYGDLVNE